jgi:outer membrane lipoprotein LolB
MVLMRPSACRGRVLLSAVCLLAGCALPAPRAVESSPKLDLTPRWSAYDVAGRIAARKGDDAFSGSFRWSHQADKDRIELASPLGQTVALMQRDEGGIRVQTPDGKSLRAPTWESLTTRVLGWPLPVSGLAYWMESAAVPQVPYEAQPDESGRPAELRQQGWTVRYREYDQQSRPTRLQLEYDTLEIRVAVDTWETPASPAH